MKFNEFDIQKKKEQFTDNAKTYNESLGNIYQWVKEDKLTPKQMGELVAWLQAFHLLTQADTQGS